MIEQTLVIVKPDAVKRGLTGEIFSRFEKAGLKMIGARMVTITNQDAQKFYAEHEGKSFFEPLTEFMSSSPIVPAVFSGENAVAQVREIIGATNPADAAEGTIRRDFALNGRENSVHGSDCRDSAAREISFFFNALEIHSNQ
jgi:nucleoside-diphosphate kinase